MLESFMEGKIIHMSLRQVKKEGVVFLCGVDQET